MSLWSELVNRYDYDSPTNKSICIGIPTINRKDLLQEGLNSIAEHSKDLPLEKIIIIDNGNQDIEPIIPNTLKSKTILFKESVNLGVAGSWNKIMQLSFDEYKCNYTLLLNDDMVIGPKFFGIYEDTLKKHPDAFIVNSPFYWSCITLTRECYNTLGLFDINFFPAYFEDNDYATRLTLYEEYRKCKGKLYVIENGLNPDITRNSGSIARDSSLNSNFAKNGNYFKEKWGGGPHHVKFKTPFNHGGDMP